MTDNNDSEDDAGGAHDADGLDYAEFIRKLKDQFNSSTLSLDLNGHYAAAPGVISPEQMEHWHKRLINEASSSISLALMVAEARKMGMKDEVLDALNSVSDAFAEAGLGTGAQGEEITVPISMECSECGESLKGSFTPGLLTITNRCRYPGGIKPYTVQLNVPSGRIVFANDLRALVTLRSLDDSYYVNHGSEIMRCTMDYADAGMIHGFTGNTCPSVYRLANGSLIVSSGSTREQMEKYRSEYPSEDGIEDDPEELSQYLPDDVVQVGSICTDLWWFSAMDHDDFLKSCTERGMDPTEFDIDIVEVGPGLWDFVIDPQARNDDGRLEIFATAHCSGPCRTVIKPFDTPARTLWETELWRRWVHSRRNYKSICRGIGEWLEHGFCVIGNGKGWTSGQLRSSEHDTRFDVLGGKRVRNFQDDPRLKAVPSLPNLFIPRDSHRKPRDGESSRTVYPMSENYATAAEIPLNADVWWLTAALVVFRTLQDQPALLSNRTTEEFEHQCRIVPKVLNLLATIVDERGLWEDLQANLLPTLIPALLEETKVNPRRGDGWAIGEPVRIKHGDGQGENGWLHSQAEDFSWHVMISPDHGGGYRRLREDELTLIADEG